MTKYLDHIAIKERTGRLSDPIPIGSSFENVYLTDEKGNTVTLKQFYDNYMKYMNETSFVHHGTIEPQNSHIKIWIDESTTNQEDVPIDFNALPLTEEDLNTKIDGVQLKTLVGEDYEIFYNSLSKLIEIRGTLKRFDNNNLFNNELKPAHHAVVLKLSSKDGYIVKTQYLDTEEYKQQVFGQDDNQAGQLIYVQAVEKDTTPYFTIFKTRQDALNNKNGLIVTLGLYNTIFEG